MFNANSVFYVNVNFHVCQYHFFGSVGVVLLGSLSRVHTATCRQASNVYELPESIIFVKIRDWHQNLWDMEDNTHCSACNVHFNKSNLMANCTYDNEKFDHPLCMGIMCRRSSSTQVALFDTHADGNCFLIMLNSKNIVPWCGCLSRCNYLSISMQEKTLLKHTRNEPEKKYVMKLVNRFIGLFNQRQQNKIAKK